MVFLNALVGLFGPIRSFAVVASILASAQAFASDDLQNLTLQLKWKHQFQFAGYYAALEKGFYREAGFDVNLKEATASTDPILEVIEGRADYGLANSELALYRLQGRQVKALAVVFQHSPIVLMTLKNSGILSPQDLIGKRVMYPQGNYGANTLGIMLREGVAANQFESVPLSFDVNDLIEGRVDAMVGYVTDQPHTLENRGVDYRLMDPRTYGIDFYGDTLFTTSERVSNRLDEVEAFRDASLKGWRYAIEHPEEVINWLLTSYASSKTREQLEYEAAETIKLIVPKLVEIGHMNPGRWKHIADTFVNLGMAEGELNTQDFLYIPEQVKSERLVSDIVKAVGLGLLIVAIGFIALVSFNKRLRKLVEENTKDLQDKNSALQDSQALLLEKEDALRTLNKSLELRVQDRTKELELLNQSLIEEVAYRKEKEVSLELLHQAIANSNSAVMVVDRNMMIDYASNALYSLTGLNEGQLSEEPVEALEPYISLPALYKGKMKSISEYRVYSEVELFSTTGDVRWLQVTISPMALADEGVSHYVVVCEDISDLKNSKDKLEKMALYDSLTGLDNRTLFNVRLEKLVQTAQRSEWKSALLFIDIDHFKGINDSYGHDAGDQVLKFAAERLKSCVRENDSIARISGDEFTVILAEIHSYQDASKVAGKIVQAFSQPVKIFGREIFVTVSIGISIMPDDGMHSDQVIRNADMAMYQAKQKGRNNFQFFSVDMNKEVQRKQALLLEMKAALAEDDFFLVYQPKVSLSTRRLVGVEALIRWRLKDQSIRNPDDFIGLAEETGLIVPIGNMVVEKAIEGFLWLQNSGFSDLKVAVNVSARQVQEKNFIENVEKCFEDHRSVIGHFELELTESAVIHETEQGIDSLNQLRKMGFSISIDDFGKGYSSLSYLQRLPIDTLKIDRSFVSSLPNDERSAEICRTIIAMANNMNFAVVAEGVETNAQADFLKANGCETIQGYLYGKPMSLKELALSFSSQKTG